MPPPPAKSPPATRPPTSASALARAPAPAKTLKRPARPSASRGSSSSRAPSSSSRDASTPAKKPRKPYTISRQRENWTASEHERFLDALARYGRSWKQIERHVKTKNVIQIRSHAQKYFIKLAKNQQCDSVPPPRPKRRSASPRTPDPSQQAQFAAAVQQHLHMFPFAGLSPGVTPGNPFLPSHPLHHVHSAALNVHALQRAAAARALSPSVAAPDADARQNSGAPAPGYQMPFVRGMGGGFALGTRGPPTGDTGLRNQLVQQQQQIQQLQQMQGMQQQMNVGSSLSDGTMTPSSLTGSASQSLGATATPSATPSPSGNNVKQQSGETGGVDRSSSPPAATSPNFTRIYGFFAQLFNPVSVEPIEKGVEELSASSLDCEIVKLLVKNLEANMSNEGFRQQLSQTYREQQVTQQRQMMARSPAPLPTSGLKVNGAEMLWLQGGSGGNTNG